MTEQHSATAPAVQSTKLTRRGKKAIVAGVVGNTVEWLDWTLYATLASIFAPLFFPPGNDTAALLFALAVFAVGFVMRPIGAMVLGPYADKYGRKKGLVLTIGMMAGSSIVIGVTPSYEHIGIFAPIILVVARLIQGFSAGGEFGSSSAYLVESAAPKRRAFAGSWQQASVGLGVLTASGMGAIITSTMSPEAVTSWGWRLAFVLAGLFGLAGLWLRSTAEETETFERAAEADAAKEAPRRSAVFAMFAEHPRATARVFGITIAGTLLYYLWMSYLPVYVSVNYDIPLSRALTANVIALTAFIVCLPFAGIVSDKLGRKPTMSFFAAGFVVFSWPAFHFLNGEFWNLLIIELIGAFFLLGYSANAAVIMSEQFPVSIRATGIGVPYALAVAVFGGTAPYVITWFRSNELQNYIWIYCMCAAAVGLFVYLTMPETAGKELD
ncbi:MFS transporter [Rhodococcus sp. 05-2255-3B1]|uniref:MFS transporter n=1 Tax=unclassified Rhodococcus (in: high G+C Gram-positive bacteria) TaxID=192944 RepID=UPI000B9A54A9|nr:MULTISPECIES: MFS transporter [unclassified Rhodococcus (in: high G+C Gram-positive bacteria)]OZE03331.1 MFS transporter [Rhodococcus sp. 05-2255-3C]OZE09718.1 MFS transporter [Rhodococcus sp. 05-2255-3B1]OZE14985.1 MFS transporter [Rhodococcus sp. 05-2255-2A2]